MWLVEGKGLSAYLALIHSQVVVIVVEGTISLEEGVEAKRQGVCGKFDRQCRQLDI